MTNIETEIIVKTEKTIFGLFISLPPGEYKATCNQNGAISAISSDGRVLGLKPYEFIFVKAPLEILKFWNIYYQTEVSKQQYQEARQKIEELYKEKL